jgi:hypothetical protein
LALTATPCKPRPIITASIYSSALSFLVPCNHVFSACW